MDPTTLVTFLYGAAADVHTVELLGSWDNFDRPYRMHHDRRRGTGFWSGCFKFDNIIFDGDSLHSTKPRSGGLKQGGVYWYYYRLNYDVETHNHRQPSTTFCPLLPGQPVNVIEVPLEIVELPTRCQSAYGPTVGSLSSWRKSQELDPANKYAMLEPPPISKVHCRAFSDCALNGRLENMPVPVVGEPVSPLGSACSEQFKNLSLDEHFPARDDVSSASSAYSQRSVYSDALGQTASDEQCEGDLSKPSWPLPSLEELTVSTFSPVASHLARADSAFMAMTPSKRKPNLRAAPGSIPDTQFHDCRPGTSRSSDHEQHRPRTHSVPSSLELDDSAAATPQRSPISLSAPSPLALACSNLDSPYTCNHMDDFDFGLASPSFSASTVSSDDGHDSPRSCVSPETPLRLPEQRKPSSQEQHTPQQRHSYEYTPSAPASRPKTGQRPNTASRLASLTHRFRYRASPPPPLPIIPHHQQAPPALNFAMNYSLPHLAVQSNNSSEKSLPKSPLPHHVNDPFVSTPLTSSSVDVTLPVIISSQSGEGESMAEAILAELGF